MGRFHDPLHGPGCSQTSYPVSVSWLLFELLCFFYPGERGGVAFGSQMLAAAPTKFRPGP